MVEESQLRMIAKQDRMINPELERFMAGRAKSETIELPEAMPYFFRIPRKLRR